MNNHQPYRDWILGEKSLSKDVELEMHQHLQQCEECRSLAEHWDAARKCLTEAGMQSPRAGFTSRWKSLAAERLRVPSPKQAWIFLAASGLGSIALTAALAAQTSVKGFSLAGVFTHSLTAATGTLKDWMDFSNTLGGLVQTISRSIPTACYLFAIFFLGLTGVLWLLLFVRAASRKEKP